MRLTTLLLSVITLSLNISFLILKDNGIFGFKTSAGIAFSKHSWLLFLLWWCLFIYRSFCQLPNWLFNTFVVANSSIILNFYITRIYVISHYYNNLSLTFYIIFFLLFIISTVFGISRLFFNLGFRIDQNPHVVLTLERLVQGSSTFFGYIGRRVGGHMPVSPGPHGFDKHYALGVGTFCATSVAATGAVYMGYEAYQTRKINERAAQAAEASAKASQESANADAASAKAAQASAKAAQASANAIQQRTDIKAVKQGLMSTEEYNRKYPK